MKRFVGIVVGSGETPRARVGARVPQLVAIANRPLIDHALDTLRDAGVRRSYVVVSEDRLAEVEAALACRPKGAPKAELVASDGPVDHVRAIEAAAPRIGDSPAIVHSGDLLLGAGLGQAASSFRRRSVHATLVVAPSGGRAPSLEARRLLKVCDGLGADVVPTTVQLLSPEAIGALVDGAKTELRYDAARVAHCWRYDGTLENVLEGNRLALEAITDVPEPELAADVRVQGKVFVDPSASIEASTIRGPAIIGAGARIREAYVGPYTCIGERVVVEGAEIEHSIVLAGAEITYVGRRIEASIVGANATVRRDFSLPHAHRLNLGDDAEICLAQ
jgi:glucose-1-phosphate thymidylyltransferase